MNKFVTMVLTVFLLTPMAHAEVGAVEGVRLRCVLTVDGLAKRRLVRFPIIKSILRGETDDDLQPIFTGNYLQEVYESSVYFLGNLITDADSGEDHVIIGVYAKQQVDQDLAEGVLHSLSSNMAWYAKPKFLTSLGVNDEFVEMDIGHFQGSTFVEGTTLRCDLLNVITSEHQNMSQ